MLENFLQLANAEKKEKTMIKEAIVKLAAKQNLDYETAEVSMDEIMGGKATSGTDECIFNRDWR